MPPATRHRSVSGLNFSRRMVITLAEAITNSHRPTASEPNIAPASASALAPIIQGRCAFSVVEISQYNGIANSAAAICSTMRYASVRMPFSSQMKGRSKGLGSMGVGVIGCKGARGARVRGFSPAPALPCSLSQLLTRKLSLPTGAPVPEMSVIRSARRVAGRSQ